MSNVPAGWYPAPGDEARMRWWDGTHGPIITLIATRPPSL